MKLKFRLLPFTAFLLSFIVASCSDDDIVVTYTGDCAITGVTMGTLTRTLHTTSSSGTDSTYVGSFAGSYYPMQIDQLKREIYNVDSLPNEAHIKKIVFSSIAADGILAYQLTTGKDTLYSSTDTLDFSQPRKFIVYSNDGNSRRTYTLRVNVHQSPANIINWQQAGTDERIASMEGMKALSFSDKLYLFGHISSAPVRFTHQIGEKDNQWTMESLEGASGIDISSIQLFDNVYYALAGGKLIRSVNGLSWVEIATDFQPEKLIGSGSKEIYAIQNGCIYVSQNGQNWSVDGTDHSTDKLPLTDIASTSSLLPANPSIENVFLIGMRNNEGVVWKKEIDLTGLESNLWSFYPTPNNDITLQPNLHDMVLVNHNNNMVCFGFIDNKVLKCKVSKDWGRTWKYDTVYTLPKGLLSPDKFSCLVDKDQTIWLFANGSGQIWKGKFTWSF